MYIKYLYFIFIFCSQKIFSEYYKPYKNAGVNLNSVRCSLNSKINMENVILYQEEINSALGTICGLNNGIFILDDESYTCANLPDKWNTTLSTLFTENPKNIVSYVKILIEAYFNTSGYASNACVGSVSELTCGRENSFKHTPYYHKLKAPIRGVNIGGLFVLERWILPDFVDWGTSTQIYDQYTFSEQCAKYKICDKLYNHWNDFYNQDDFYQMKNAGLNTVRVPVGHWYFSEISGFYDGPYIRPHISIYDMNHPITKIISYANNANLYVILDLHTAPGSQNGFDNSGQETHDPQPDHWGQHWIYDKYYVNSTINTNIAMVYYIEYIKNTYNIDNVIMIELLNEPWQDIDLSLIKNYYYDTMYKIRNISNIPILLHDSFRGLQWNTLLKDFPFEHVYFDTHSYQCFSLGDVASNTYDTDKLKIYVHLMATCASNNILHYETCTTLPTLVGEWSVAIDDCMPYLNARFQNVGQCDRLYMRNNSYWREKYRDFAYKQMSVFENELGWTFWTWKLSDYAEKMEISSMYWSFRLLIQNGYINLHDYNSIENACNFDPNYPELSKINDSKVSSIEYVYIVGFLLFISSALISYSTYKYCVNRYHGYTQIQNIRSSLYDVDVNNLFPVKKYYQSVYVKEDDCVNKNKYTKINI